MSFSFALSEIYAVRAYKLDEITTDLICFDITFDYKGERKTLTIHEDQPDFESKLAKLAVLSNFRVDWKTDVLERTFERCEIVVFQR